MTPDEKHAEFQANFSIAVPIDDLDDDEPTVTGVTLGSGGVRHGRDRREGVREQDSAMDGRGARGW